MISIIQFADYLQNKGGDVMFEQKMAKSRTSVRMYHWTYLLLSKVLFLTWGGGVVIHAYNDCTHITMVCSVGV